MTRASLVRACLLAALAAFVTLFVQVLVHRVISAKLLNNYAFLVISLTMLGFAFSGAMLTRWLELNSGARYCCATKACGSSSHGSRNSERPKPTSTSSTCPAGLTITLLGRMLP